METIPALWERWKILNYPEHRKHPPPLAAASSVYKEGTGTEISWLSTRTLSQSEIPHLFFRPNDDLRDITLGTLSLSHMSAVTQGRAALLSTHLGQGPWCSWVPGRVREWRVAGPRDEKGKENRDLPFMRF